MPGNELVSLLIIARIFELHLGESTQQGCLLQYFCARLLSCIFLGLLAVFAVYHKLWFCSNMKFAQRIALAIACN